MTKINYKIKPTFRTVVWIDIFFAMVLIGLTIFKIIIGKVGFTDLFFPISMAGVFIFQAYIFYIKKVIR